MPILLPDIAWELIWELNKTIFVGEAVRLTDLPAGSWSGSGHLNRGHEAVDASPHPNRSVKASRFDLVMMAKEVVTAAFRLRGRAGRRGPILG